MSDGGIKTLAILLGGVLLLLLIVLSRPGYLTRPEVLGAVVIGQVVFAAVFRYRKTFFLILMVAFLWAGMDIPFQIAWLQGRWYVLGLGAVAGLAIYMKDQNHHFSTFHLIALFGVLGAMISALVSAYPEEALLKAVSLLFLFLYGATGARLAVPAGRPEDFFRRLVVACEFLTYASTVSYFLFHWKIYGSPNSLGAVMGVVVVPLLLWGLLSSESVIRRRRLGFELVLAMLLLMSSFSRAGMAAAAISSLLMCASFRRYRTMLKGIALVVVMAFVVATVVPLPEEVPDLSGENSVSDLFLYKGKYDQGVLGSRQGPWNQTWSVISEHPWFGSGFGTSLVGQDLTQLTFAQHVDSRVVREHGNSYLAIAEWTGLLGVAPFYCLIVMIAMNAGKAFSWMRRTGDVLSPVVPAAAVVVAGLINAMFEDWMFAVGYHLCVLFWILAFILVDLISSRTHYSREAAIPLPTPQLGFVAYGQ